MVKLLTLMKLKPVGKRQGRGILGNLPDISPDALRDDDPDPSGRIYDIDSFGIKDDTAEINNYQFPGAPLGAMIGDFQIARCNFREWAELKCGVNWIRISGYFTWTASISIQLTQVDATHARWIATNPPTGINRCPEVGPGSMPITLTEQ